MWDRPRGMLSCSAHSPANHLSNWRRQSFLYKFRLEADKATWAGPREGGTVSPAQPSARSSLMFGEKRKPGSVEQAGVKLNKTALTEVASCPCGATSANQNLSL